MRLFAPTSRRTGWICNSFCQTKKRDRSAPLSSSFQHGDRFIAYDDATRIGLLPGDEVTALLAVPNCAA